MINFTNITKKAILKNDQALAVNENTLKLIKLKIDVIKKKINIDFARGYVNDSGEYEITDTQNIVSIEATKDLYDLLITQINSDSIIIKLEKFIVNNKVIKHLGDLREV